MSTPAVIDFDKLSTDDLRAEALKWATGAEEAQPTTNEPARDEQGRFKAPDVKEAPATVDEEVVYQRVIDLGDGSGVQVFEAQSMEELVEKLAKAQENATRKIREQETRLRTQPKPQETPDEVENLTDAEKFLLQQEMLADPAKAIQRFVNKAVEKREREATQAAERTKSATDAFIANNTGYFTSPKNGQKIVKWLETYNLDVTEDNLKNAFDDLSTSGLLEARPAEVKETPAETKGEKPQEARIEPTATAQTVVRRRVVGDVSVKRSAPAPVQTPELTEEQLQKMPLHELEALTRRKLLGG